MSNSISQKAHAVGRSEKVSLPVLIPVVQGPKVSGKRPRVSRSIQRRRRCTGFYARPRHLSTSFSQKQRKSSQRAILSGFAGVALLSGTLGQEKASRESYFSHLTLIKRGMPKVGEFDLPQLSQPYGLLNHVQVCAAMLKAKLCGVDASARVTE